MKTLTEEQLFSELGKRIADARKQHGYSQERLASLTGIDRVAIGYIEQGRRKPTVTTAFRIAKGLNMRLEELFSGF